MSGRSSARAARAAAVAALLVFGALGAVLLLGRGLPVAGAVCAVAAVAAPVHLLLEASRREFVLTPSTLLARGGLLCRYEATVALDRVGGVSVHQDPVQRLLGCGDVRVFAHGIGATQGLVATAADMHSIRLRSIPEFRRLAEALRRQVDARISAGRGAAPGATAAPGSATLLDSERAADVPIAVELASHPAPATRS